MKNLKHLFLVVLLIATTISFVSCSNDDEPNHSFSDVSLKAGQTMSIANSSDLTWSSSNELIAKLENGVLYGKHVGTATLQSNKGSFKAEVTPTSTIYKDPYLVFGATESSTKSWMTQNISSATYMGDSNNMLVYSCSTGAAGLYGYSFTNGKLSMAVVMVKYSYSNELVDFLTERYIVVTGSLSDKYIGMISPDKEMLIILQPYVYSGTIIWEIAYSENTTTSSRATENQFKKLIKPVELNTIESADFSNIYNRLFVTK